MRGLVFTVLCITSWQVFAQATVVEAGGGPVPRANAPVAQQGGGNELLLSLYNQLEALQMEMQTLRGIVEEQGYQLRQLQEESRERYLDLDQRLSSGGPAQALPGVVVGGVDTVSPPGQTAPGNFQTVQPGLQGNTANVQPFGAGAVGSQPPVDTAGTTGMNDDELYNSALNLLLEERRYEESSAQFQQYIDSYPTGRRFTNALYWQGEALILLQRLPQARDVFMRLMNEFPQDAKTPGAMLKLGVVYSQMGNRAQAEQLWRELPARYPDSSAEIREAERFLNQ